MKKQDRHIKMRRYIVSGLSPDELTAILTYAVGVEILKTSSAGYLLVSMSTKTDHLLHRLYPKLVIELDIQHHPLHGRD